MDLMPRLHLLFGIDAVARVEVDIFLQDISGQCLRRVPQIRQAAALRLLDPVLLIAVAAEDDPAVPGKGLLQQIVQRLIEILRLF